MCLIAPLVRRRPTRGLPQTSASRSITASTRRRCSTAGTGEAPVAPVFMDGEKHSTLRGEGLTEDFLELIEQYVRTRYGERSPGE